MVVVICTPHPFNLSTKGTLIITHFFLYIEERAWHPARSEKRMNDGFGFAWERLTGKLAGSHSMDDDIQGSLFERSA
jgi:hypothetical protein